MNAAESAPHIGVIGAGIAGLGAAVDLVNRGCNVVVFEASSNVGGKLVSSSFAGIDGIDEGADAYLTRVPAAVALATQVGIDDAKHPTNARAAVWLDGLHPLPRGLMLGIPSSVLPLLRSRLLSLRGKARAAADLLIPASSADHDCLGALSRQRLGDEVHERLIDTLIGSIYATDTDNSSLAAVPQIAALSTGRSLILQARSAAQRRGPTPTPADIFAAPASGMQTFATGCADWLAQRGVGIELGQAIATIEPQQQGWKVVGVGGGEWELDGAVIATPSSVAGGIAERSGWIDAYERLASIDAADVIMVRLRIPADQWPSRLRGLSGYLVPKPQQSWVTAASFGSQKWNAWQLDNGDQIVRISLGRDQLPTAALNDDDAIATAVAEFGRHVGVDIVPTEASLTRWVEGFPQYRPHHHDLVASIEAALPSGIAVAGASYRGIGIPACITSGQVAVARVLNAVEASVGSFGRLNGWAEWLG